MLGSNAIWACTVRLITLSQGRCSVQCVSEREEGVGAFQGVEGTREENWIQNQQTSTTTPRHTQ
eukprot:380692-Amorphochlora_amoeboformis.AAC.1